MHEHNNLETLIVLQPIAVDTGSDDREGMLVLANGMLVAVLVQLDASEHDHREGYWFLECGFGRLQGIVRPPFESLDAATRWLRRRMKP